MGLALGILGALASTYNQQRTLNRQDQQAAEGIRNPSRIQQRADSRVNEEVAELEKSTSADEKAKALSSYADALRTNRGAIDAGLTSGVGGKVFDAEQAQAKEGVVAEGGQTADLMARMDAPGMQRQGEAFGFGRLGTDLGMLSRESSGQSWIDELRFRRIRENPWLGAAGGILTGLGGGMMGGSSFGPTGKPFGGMPNLKPGMT